jgi:predicted DNA-binding transcriptional regulator AlpA
MVTTTGTATSTTHGLILPHDRLLTRQDLLRITGWSAPTLRKAIRQGRVPSPVRLGDRSLRWPPSAVAAIVHSN